MMWGGHAVVGKAIEGQMQPAVLTFWRFGLGTLCYAPWWPRLRRIVHWPRRMQAQLLLAAVLSCVLYPLFYYAALRDLSPVASLLFVNTAPLVAAVLSRLFFKERLGWLGYAGMGTSFCGVIVLVIGEWQGGVSATGVGLVLVATVAFAGYTVVSRPLFARSSLMDVLVGTSAIGTFLLLLTIPFAVSPAHLWAGLTGLDRSGWLELGYIVVIVSTAAYVLYGFGLRRVPSGIAAALTFYPQVVFGALLQWLWLGLRPTSLVVVAGAFILGGTALLRQGEARKARRAEATSTRADGVTADGS